ncbi:azurin [Pseudomonas putida]|uniref:Azurin n=1 Tax=Pseudomonas putida TaxID=303 RepID=A0A379KE32_PSEPU|nr:azurin [Pseudomonas putida]
MRNAIILGMLVSTGTVANDCQIVVTSNDQMQFSTKQISIPKSCTQYAITLKHISK